MSSSSTVTRPRGRLPSTRSMSVIGLVADLVQELLDRLAYALQPSRLRHRQVIGDVPAFCRDLVLGEVVLCLRAADPRPALPRRSMMSRKSGIFVAKSSM